MKNNFKDNGFIVIKKAIDKKILIKLKKIVNTSSDYSYQKFKKK